MTSLRVLKGNILDRLERELNGSEAVEPCVEELFYLQAKVIGLGELPRPQSLLLNSG